MTANPVNKSSVRPDTPAAHGTDKLRKNKRVSFCFSEESKTSNCSWIDGSEASACKPAVQTTEKQTPQTSLKIPATNMEEQNLQFDSDASLVSQMKIFKDELKHCEDIKQLTISLQIKTPSCFSSRHSQSNTLQKADAPRPKCVKWKSVMIQRAQSAASESPYPTHRPWSRFTLTVCSSPEGGSDADRPDKRPQSSAEGRVESGSSGDSLIPQ